MPERSEAIPITPPIASISRIRWPFPRPPIAGLQDIIPRSLFLNEIIAVLAPILSAAIAASIPACPAPITKISNVFIIVPRETFTCQYKIYQKHILAYPHNHFYQTIRPTN